jgi:hypothetical protein
MTDALEVKALEGEVIESENNARKSRGQKPLKQYKIMFHEVNGNKSDVEIIHNFVKKTFPRNKWKEIDENFMSVVRDSIHQSTRIMRDHVTGEDIKEEINTPTLHYSLEAI